MQRISSRELAYCGTFGAAALLMPTLFHVVRLGPVFMPLYIPLIALAFFVRPGAAALTAFMVPILSAAVTGMPPFYPPVAFIIAIEVSLVSFSLSLFARKAPGRIWQFILILLYVVAGRLLHVVLVYVTAALLHLPAGFLAGSVVISSWPGVLLILVTVPPFVARFAPRTDPESTYSPY